MKRINFFGRSLENIKSFPHEAKREVGYQLDKVQNGLSPNDWKPMKNVGAGVNEIRVKDAGGIYRVIYVAKFEETIYVLHAFQKKTQKTSKADIEIAAKAYSKIVGARDE